MKLGERIRIKLKSEKCDLTREEKEYMLKSLIALECFRQEEFARQLKYGR
jgi:hypothetical protein